MVTTTDLHNASHSALGGALSLTGIDACSSTEKSIRVAALVKDMYASIIFISRHVNAGTLDKNHCQPIYDLVNLIITTERKENRKLLRELDRQDARMEKIARRHRKDVKKLLRLARRGILHLRGHAERLQIELDELKGKRTIRLDNVKEAEAMDE